MTKEKLVRDNIPEIMEKDGKEVNVRVAKEQEMDYLLRIKILEEALELLQSGDTEEIVDVLEAVQALVALKKIDYALLEVQQHAKRLARGGFERGYVLSFED